MATSDLPRAPDSPDLPPGLEATTELDARPGDQLAELLLEGVDLTGAVLREATLRDVVAVEGSWANVDAERARLRRVEARNVRATGARFDAATLLDVTFRNCRLDLASFRCTELERVVLEGCRLDEADFYEAKLTSVVFVDCSLARASIAGATFVRSELRGCDLSAIGNPERLRGVRMPWPDVVAAAAVLADAVGIEILER